MFLSAHKWIRGTLPIPIKKTRAQRRDDIVVSYADGPGKSGAHYAQIYVHTNEIVSANIVPPKELEERLGDCETHGQVGLVIVDDMIGTGSNLIDRLSSLKDVFSRARVGTEVPLSLIVLFATTEGERRVRKHLGQMMVNADLHVCETLENRHFAFRDPIGIWETENERNAAKTLMADLGVRIQKRKPLGFGDQGFCSRFLEIVRTIRCLFCMDQARGVNTGFRCFHVRRCDERCRRVVGDQYTFIIV